MSASKLFKKLEEEAEIGRAVMDVIKKVKSKGKVTRTPKKVVPKRRVKAAPKPRGRAGIGAPVPPPS